jgi:hypothetical protein
MILVRIRGGDKFERHGTRHAHQTTMVAISIGKLLVLSSPES